MNELPMYDAAGLHILDPHDSLGVKSSYITLLQEKALRKYLPQGNGGIAVDLGCGFGRLTPLLSEFGWRAIGIDPSPDLLEFAQRHYPGPEYRQGGLPNLPMEDGAISLLLIQNVLRSLKMMGRLEWVQGMGRFLAPNAKVFVIENIRDGIPAYLPESEIIAMMRNEGLRMVGRIPLRAARWWGIYLIRYGLIPRSWLDRTAVYELGRMAQRTGLPRRQYWNVLFIFEKS